MITALIYDPLEAEMSDVGRTVVSEGPLQIEINTSDSRLREDFKKEFEERLERSRKFARQRAIPLLPIQTGEDVAVQIRRLLGQAIAGGRK